MSRGTRVARTILHQNSWQTCEDISRTYHQGRVSWYSCPTSVMGFLTCPLPLAALPLLTDTSEKQLVITHRKTTLSSDCHASSTITIYPDTVCVKGILCIVSDYSNMEVHHYPYAKEEIARVICVQHSMQVPSHVYPTPPK